MVVGKKDFFKMWQESTRWVFYSSGVIMTFYFFIHDWGILLSKSSAILRFIFHYFGTSDFRNRTFYRCIYIFP